MTTRDEALKRAFAARAGALGASWRAEDTVEQTEALSDAAFLASLRVDGWTLAPVEATESVQGTFEKAHRALSPFVFEAKAYDPPEDDDNQLLYGEHHLTIGHLRNARDAYDAILSLLGNRAMLESAKEDGDE